MVKTTKVGDARGWVKFAKKGPITYGDLSCWDGTVNKTLMV